MAEKDGEIRPEPMKRAGVAPAEHADLIALLDQWLVEDTAEGAEAAWRKLQRGIEGSRTSTRNRFSE